MVMYGDDDGDVDNYDDEHGEYHADDDDEYGDDCSDE